MSAAGHSGPLAPVRYSILASPTRDICHLVRLLTLVRTTQPAPSLRMDRTSIRPMDQISEVSSRKSIGRLHLDILILIFQIIIDEDNINIHSRKKAPTIARLALVNKRWKDIVYETPSFWSTVKVTLFEPADLEQSRLDRFTTRAKNYPVDLYLHGVHSHAEGASYSFNHPKNCACHGDQLAVNLQGIQNLRSLTVTLWGLDAAVLINPESLPSLASVRQLRYRFKTERGNVELELESLLSRMPKLAELNIDGIDMIVLPTPKPPLLPHLHTLDVKFSTPSTASLLLSLLLHCPNLVNLQVGCSTKETGLDITKYPTIILYGLKRLHIPNVDIIRQIFATGLVKTPVLEELYRGLWDNITFEAWRGIFASSTTLKKLTIRIYTHAQYDRGLREVPNLEDLTLTLYDPPTSRLLSLLCLPDTTSPDPAHHLEICPNLRCISFEINFTLISLHAFETFLHTRCIPIDEECRTVAGYRVIDSVIFRFFNVQTGEKVMAELRECAYGKKAVVRRLSLKEYKIHWLFRENSPICF